MSSGTYLVSVIPAHGLWVDANFKEDRLARMTPGEPATVVADAFRAIMIAFVVATLLVPLMRNVAARKAPAPDAH